MNIGTELGKIGKVVAWPFENAARIIGTLETVLKDEPAVKAEITALIQQIDTLTKDGAVAVAAKGFDIPDDVATVAAAQTLWAYVTGTFLPGIEAAYKDVKEQAEPAPAAEPAEAAAAAVMAGPGLHTVTAD